MKNAIYGYWKIFRDEGFLRAFSSFYDYLLRDFLFQSAFRIGKDYLFRDYLFHVYVIKLDLSFI